MKDTILVVDDSILICNIVEKKLMDENLNVIKAYDGTSALSLIKIEKPSLILLDLMLPDMDGYTICEKVKKDPSTSDIPIVFLTSKEDEKSIVKAFSVGAIDYISKPFSTIELNVRVKAHLENKKTRDALKQANLELEKALIENKRLAFTDKLTGLYNRHYFLENIEDFIKDYKPSNSYFWVILFDIDDFKKINDTYGHYYGDCVLAKVAAIIQKHCSDFGVTCRWGGEEFISSIYGLDENEIEERVKNICTEVLETNFGDNSVNIYCTLSIGVSKYDYAMNIDENIILADKAMYHQKRNGKNGYYFIY